MKEFLRKKGLRLAIIVLAAALIVGLSARALDGRAGFLSDFAGKLRQPVQKAATAASDWLESVYGYLYEYDQLVAQINSLKKQLVEAEERARAGEAALEENARFRELFGYLESHSDFVTESAKIVSWNASNWTSSFTISKGEESGIELGDPVITEYGALVGQITELGETWAVVGTVIDVDASIGALVGSDGSAGVVVGNYALMQQNAAKLTYMTGSAQMFVGDEVRTSGMGGAFPQGVSIGTVTSIKTEAGGQQEYGVMTPACDLGSVVQVFIIKDFDVVE